MFSGLDITVNNIFAADNNVQIGTAQNPIKDMYISANSLHIGNSNGHATKISVSNDGKIQFIKTKGAGGTDIPEVEQKQDTGIAEAASATFDQTTDISVNNLTVFGDLSGGDVNINKINFGSSNISADQPIGGLSSSVSIRANNQSHLYIIADGSSGQSHSSVNLVRDEYNDNSPDWSFWNYDGKLHIYRKLQQAWKSYVEFDQDDSKSYPIKFNFGVEIKDISCSNLKMDETLVDTINEKTSGTGTTINGVTLKNNSIIIDNDTVISASKVASFTDLEVKKSNNTGLIVFGDTGNMDLTGTLKVDTINEKTAANGVVIENITLKDGTITATDTITTSGSITATGSITTTASITAKD